MSKWLLLLVVFLAAQSTLAQVKDPSAHFLGMASCQSSGCHGGGTGKDQALIWLKRDVHTRAHAILGTARSLRIADSLGIADPLKETQCTVCHSPLHSVPPGRLAQGVKPDTGVSCETCHGAAEPWLRFHTRSDVTHEQRIAAGMREVKDLVGRAGVCVACHLNIDIAMVKAGHPEMFFELDGQMRNEPPHWREVSDAWLGPKAWLVGQAVALRELSWKLATRPDDSLVPRWRALIWLLRQTQLGASQLSDRRSPDYKGTQSASDRLARSASRTAWTRESAGDTLRKLVRTSAEFRAAGVPEVESRRRAEVLVLAIDRLWQALKANGAASSTFDAAVAVAAGEARAQAGFDSARFAAALEQIEVALERPGR